MIIIVIMIITITIIVIIFIITILIVVIVIIIIIIIIIIILIIIVILILILIILILIIPVIIVVVTIIIIITIIIVVVVIVTAIILFFIFVITVTTMIIHHPSFVCTFVCKEGSTCSRRCKSAKLRFQLADALVLGTLLYFSRTREASEGVEAEARVLGHHGPTNLLRSKSALLLRDVLRPPLEANSSHTSDDTHHLSPGEAPEQVAWHIGKQLTDGTA